MALDFLTFCIYLTNTTTISHNQNIKDIIDKLYAGSRLLLFLLTNMNTIANIDKGITEK
jgi:hypothetical protein